MAGPQIGVTLSLKGLMACGDKEPILATGKPIRSEPEAVVMKS